MSSGSVGVSAEWIRRQRPVRVVGAKLQQLGTIGESKCEVHTMLLAHFQKNMNHGVFISAFVCSCNSKSLHFKK